MTEKHPLTDIAIRKLRPPEHGQIELWDRKISGFGVRVSANGTKAFVLLYRFDGRLRRFTLGRYPDLTLAKARGKAQNALSLIASGADPQDDKDEMRRADVFASIIDEFVTIHCQRHNRPRTAAETERQLRAEFLPEWGKRRITQIAKPDVLRVLDAIVAREAPSAANHALAAIRKLFNWCVSRGYLNASPCSGIALPAKLNARDRVLDDSELTAVWKGASKIGYPFSAIVHLLILTAQRRGEVAGMRWRDIELSKRVWSIASHVAKSGRAHEVPLGVLAADILITLPHLEGEWLFPANSKTGQHYRNFTFAKAQLDEISGVTDWTLHDLRRTAATGMARIGVAPHVIEHILNHRTGTLGGVAGIYNRFGYLDEMRAALERWEEYVKRLIEQDDRPPASRGEGQKVA